MGQVIPYRTFFQLRATRFVSPRADCCLLPWDGSCSVIISIKSREDITAVADRIAQVQNVSLGRGNLYMRALVSRCVYRKPKPVHNGDGVRQVSRVILLIRSAEPGARLAHLCSMTDVF